MGAAPVRAGRQRGIIGRLANLLLALLVAGIVLTAFGRGVGTAFPSLGAAFNPGTGAWTMAADARLPHDQTLRLQGLRGAAQVVFEANGTAHVRAATDHDLWLVDGYLEARFRLFEMDLLRREGEGGLSEIVGPPALSTDRFELRLGLLRTAQAEWRQMGSGDAGRAQLLAYAQGVNDRITEDRNGNNLPALFKVLGYTPRPWRPVDSLAIQGVETQDLDFTDAPLDYAVLVRTLGYKRTMNWFPVLPANNQHPYDAGPYSKSAVQPLPSQLSPGNGVAQAVDSLGARLEALPYGLLARGGNSNNWVIGGARTASGKPMLAGDPHLHQTLPAIWYQWSGDSPHFHFAGVAIPGTPGIIIGHNRHVAWSLTNVQNQATLFYIEKTEAAHPHQYFWKGTWRKMRRLHYAIPVKGAGPDRIEVDVTVHGPIVTSSRVPGKKIAIDWMGALPSPDTSVLLHMLQASGAAQVRAALRNWHAPSQNFAYADDQGHIGLTSAGYYPIVRHGAPWLPLPGTGKSDVVGTIPYKDVPQVQDPPSHFALSANQRPVGAAYPYYIGTSLDFFDNGYRAGRIEQVLSHAHDFTERDMEKLQNDVQDSLAAKIVPKLLEALKGDGTLRPLERQAMAALRTWNDSMDVNSPAASIWWRFWSRYLHDTFDPWWSAFKVPKRFSSIRVGPNLTPLDEDLEQWTLHEPGNAAFGPPSHGPSFVNRSSTGAMLQAFTETVQKLRRQFGPNVSNWRWGRLHSRQFDSLALISSLGYGPRASSADQWTVNAADSGYNAGAGPSWRFIMDWGTGRAEGVYPGGESENPMSPWYENQIATWWAGKYYPMLDFGAAKRAPRSVTWQCEP